MALAHVGQEERRCSLPMSVHEGNGGFLGGAFAGKLLLLDDV